MNKEPSFKIMIPFSAIYTLLLFIPTIDALAIVNCSIFSWEFNFSVAALLFPAIFPLEASLTEVYAKKYVYYVVFSCYLIVVLFSLLHNFMLSEVENIKLYSVMIAPSLTITIIGPISYLVISYLNINLLAKLKITMRSRHFIFRSVTCSLISGFVMSFMVQFFIHYDKGMHYFFRILFSTVAIKSLVTVLYVYLAKILVVIYRYVDELDVPPSFNNNLVKNSMRIK